MFIDCSMEKYLVLSPSVISIKCLLSFMFCRVLMDAFKHSISIYTTTCSNGTYIIDECIYAFFPVFVFDYTIFCESLLKVWVICIILRLRVYNKCTVYRDSVNIEILAIIGYRL